jgi:hypothetical protein
LRLLGRGAEPTRAAWSKYSSAAPRKRSGEITSTEMNAEARRAAVPADRSVKNMT